MANKTTFPDRLSKDELEFRATKSAEKEYNRKLSESELQQLAEDMLANHDFIGDLQQELKDHSKQVREEVKQIRAKNTSMRSERKSGIRTEHGTVRMVMDYEGMRVGEYTPSGDLIRVRSMNSKETQMRIDEQAEEEDKQRIIDMNPATGTDGK